MGWRRDFGVTHRTMAEAFHAGLNRGNADYIRVERVYEQRDYAGLSYIEYRLYGNVIARRIAPEDLPNHIAWAIEKGVNAREELEFSFAGWVRDTTMRHLNALGVRAETVLENEYGPRGGIKAGRRVALLNGREVNPNEFYGLRRLAAMPAWKQPEMPAWAVRASAPRRVAYALQAGQQELSFA